MIDASIVRAHQHSAGARGGQENEALGRSCGGFTTKIHAKVDSLGLPLKFLVTAGYEHEVKSAESLLKGEKGKYLLADKGYDDNKFRELLIKSGIEAVIPSKKNRLITIPHDEIIYKERNQVERFFNKIKGFRRVATRYDKTASMFLGTLTIASILLWLKL